MSNKPKNGVTVGRVETDNSVCELIRTRGPETNVEMGEYHVYVDGHSKAWMPWVSLKDAKKRLNEIAGV